MKLSEILNSNKVERLNEAIQDYEFYIDQEKMVHTLQANKDLGVKSPKDFQIWLQKSFPGSFQKIWQALVQQKKFSGKAPPEDMTVGGQVSQGVGD